MAEYYDYIDNTGVIVPDTDTLLADVQNEYKVAFGADLNVASSNTPQGILIASETLARANVLANNSQMANQINPNIAGGIFLDALMALMGSFRASETYTTVSANLTGIPRTPIPLGSQAQNSVTLELFTLISNVTLAIDGTGTGIFQAVNPGPLSCEPDTLTTIVTGAIGWETVTNPTAGSLGTLTQSDVQARNLRNNTLAGQSSALAEAIVTELYLTQGVKSVTFRENVLSTTQVIDGITMVAKSIYACVDGGSDMDVATALVNKKSGGCAYNGSVTVPYTIPFSGQVMDILFDRPTLKYILIRATVKANSSIQDPTNTVRQAILDYADGLLSGEPGFVVGASVSAFELAGAVNIAAPSIFVQNMEISLLSPVSYTNTTISLQIFEKAATAVSYISVILL